MATLGRRIQGGLLLLVVVWCGGGEATAQSAPASASSAVSTGRHFCTTGPEEGSLDARGLSLIYCASQPGITAPLRAAHASARPAFYGAVPAAWIGAGVTQEAQLAASAYRLTLTQSFSYGLITGLKHLIGRPRPYVTHPLKARVERHPSPGEAWLSFPSGHAGLSAALVTSWSLSYSRWYVIGPGAVWATSVALSRLHLGVHYPSDILAGSLLGAGIAVLVHELRRALTPARLQASPGTSRLRAPPLVLRMQF